MRRRFGSFLSTLRRGYRRTVSQLKTRFPILNRATAVPTATPAAVAVATATPAAGTPATPAHTPATGTHVLSRWKATGILAMLIVTWIVHVNLGYATSSPRGLLASLFVLPLLYVFFLSQNRNRLMYGLVIAAMLFFGWRTAGHGSGNDPDIIAKALFWVLAPRYLFGVFFGR